MTALTASREAPKFDPTVRICISTLAASRNLFASNSCLTSAALACSHSSIAALSAPTSAPPLIASARHRAPSTSDVVHASSWSRAITDRSCSAFPCSFVSFAPAFNDAQHAVFHSPTSRCSTSVHASSTTARSSPRNSGRSKTSGNSRVAFDWRAVTQAFPRATSCGLCVFSLSAKEAIPCLIASLSWA